METSITRGGGGICKQTSSMGRGTVKCEEGEQETVQDSVEFCEVRRSVK